LRGTPATRSAKRRTSASSSAAGTDAVARPHSSAVRPSIRSPVKSSRFARIAPTR
jgi:hypothetical protein